MSLDPCFLCISFTISQTSIGTRGHPHVFDSRTMTGCPFCRTFYSFVLGTFHHSIICPQFPRLLTVLYSWPSRYPLLPIFSVYKKKTKKNTFTRYLILSSISTSALKLKFRKINEKTPVLLVANKIALPLKYSRSKGRQ